MNSSEKSILRLNLINVERSLKRVERNWERINDELERKKIGRKDTFNADIRDRMMAAYEHFDRLLRNGIEPLSSESIQEACELNNLVHYGSNSRLRQEYAKAIIANERKYNRNIGPIMDWYMKHMRPDPHPLKVAAEVYVAVLGHPQLFIEGNHRTGSIISSWISMHHGHPPFVLSPENAIAYFEPSAKIKMFADKSTWKGRFKLPKYRKSFKRFWQEYIDSNYVK
jgi:hypothetical protein